MFELSYNPWERAVSYLLILALFFAMRSCEYLETSSKEESKRTKILRLKNIKFKKKGKLISQKSSTSTLKSADIIIITFEFQKNDWRNHTVHMWSTNDPLLCPVKAGAMIVKRVRSIPSFSDNTKVCSYITEDKSITNINSSQVLSRLRTIVNIIGEATLGFTESDIGLHSIRSGGAMAMFLSGISTIIIQRVGRWSSEAFLEYIREQVENFTHGVSQKMLNFEHFQTLNENEIPNKDELAEIFVEDKGDGSEPICIEHELEFNKLSLN